MLALVQFRRCLGEGIFIPLWNALRALFGLNALLVIAGLVLRLRTYARALAADRRQQDTAPGS